jgi:hypothetical protein
MFSGSKIDVPVRNDCGKESYIDRISAYGSKFKVVDANC